MFIFVGLANCYEQNRCAEWIGHHLLADCRNERATSCQSRLQFASQIYENIHMRLTIIRACLSQFQVRLKPSCTPH